MMTTVALQALANALEQWPCQEAFGTATDDRYSAVAYGTMIDGVMFFYEPVVIRRDPIIVELSR